MTENKTDASVGEAFVKHDYITRTDLEEAQEREASTGTPWHRHLLQMKKISFGLLEDLLTREYHTKSERDKHETLGQTLVKLKAITRQQLNEALKEHDRSGRLIGMILKEKGYVTSRAIGLALADQHGLEYTSLEDTPSSLEALEAVPMKMALNKHMLPVSLEGDRLTVLIADPQAKDEMGNVGIILAKRMHPVLTSSDDIDAEISERYATPGKPKKKGRSRKTAVKSPKPVPATKQEITEVMQDSEERTIEMGSRFEDIAREASGAPVIKLVRTIINGAINSGATDIHLDPQEPEMRVRYRIDGILHDIMSIDAEDESAVVSRIKIMSDIDITETRHPQDGHIGFDIGDAEYDIRVATLPTFLGERVVLRLLDQSSVLSGIRDLGLEKDDEKKLTSMIDQPYGMVLVTGPTGSGKTTTLYAALNQKDVMTESIVTLEDPVEYQLSGINQVQIDTDIELTFAQTLRATLRQDIDVILVGEIRDPETARIAIRAAMTGHLVFSTLHTNDAPEAVSTLRNMTVPSFLIASALTGIVGQRLVRTICPKCKTGFTPDKALLKSLRLSQTTKKLYKGAGCDNCYNTGSKGRTGIFEIIQVTPSIRELIASEASIVDISKAAKLRTMADRCRLKVKNGIIAPKEFLEVIRT